MSLKICIAGNFNIAVNGAQFVLNKYKDCQLFAVLNKSDHGSNIWQPSYKKFCAGKFFAQKNWRKSPCLWQKTYSFGAEPFFFEENLPRVHDHEHRLGIPHNLAQFLAKKVSIKYFVR